MPAWSERRRSAIEKTFRNQLNTSSEYDQLRNEIRQGFGGRLSSVLHRHKIPHGSVSQNPSRLAQAKNPGGNIGDHAVKALLRNQAQFVGKANLVDHVAGRRYGGIGSQRDWRVGGHVLTPQRPSIRQNVRRGTPDQRRGASSNQFET